MVPEDDSRKRWREREDEREKEEQVSQNKKSGGTSDIKMGRAQSGTPESDKLDELLSRAEPLIEQVNQLYQMYAVGVEKLPPHERRKQLDQLMATIQMIGKPNPAMAFRANSIQSRYVAHRDRWDRILKDLESGKLKRVTGPKR